MSAENLKADFNKILKSSIIPMLKEMGFKRKGQNFIRPVNDITQCVNVQKRSRSHFDSMDFTFNIGFYNKQIRDIAYGKDSMNDFPKVTDCFIEFRLKTYPRERGSWYDLNNRIDKEKLAAQVEGGLEHYLKPLFEKHQSLEDLTQLVKEKDTLQISPECEIVFFMITNQIEMGIRLLREKHKEALAPQTLSVTTINIREQTETKTETEYINTYYIESMERLAKTYGISLEKEGL